MQGRGPGSVGPGKRGRNLLELKTRPARVGVAVDDADEVRTIGIAEFAGYLHCDRLARTGREAGEITQQRTPSGGLCRAQSTKRYRALSSGYRNEPCGTGSDLATMTGFPNAFAWRAACAADPVLATWAGPWAVWFAIKSGNDAAFFKFVQGNV